MPVSVLSGGVGGARFLSGLTQVLQQSEISAVVNTGDDCEMYNLHVSPDIDIVIYTLAGIINKANGWGIAGDTHSAMDALARLGEQNWFTLGDRDLATQIYRSAQLAKGASLGSITQNIARAYGLSLNMFPMSEDRVRTRIRSGETMYEFQEYMVRERHSVPVDEIIFEGIEHAVPAPGVLEALASSDTIIIAPSNPFISVGPILSVGDVRRQIADSPAKRIALSPIVSGKAVKGPLADLMAQFGHHVSPVGIAEIYQGLIDVLVIDEADAQHAAAIEKLGIRVVPAKTMMIDDAAKRNLAALVMEL